MTMESARISRHQSITDPDAAIANAVRETDALAAMMGADSHRIDNLVQDVGEIKGDVRAVKSDVAGMSRGVDELRGALASLLRQEVILQHQSTAVQSVQTAQKDHEERLQSLERKAPGWDEIRSFVSRGVVAVLSVVGLALLALVVKGAP